MNTTQTHQTGTGDEQSLLSTIPADLIAEVDGVTVREYGVGSGPGCMCGKVRKHPEGCSLEQALSFLEKYRSSLRRAHILFSGGQVFWFSRAGYLRFEVKASPAGIPARSVFGTPAD